MEKNIPEITSKISIIVPVHNGGDKFRSCMLSLNAMHPKPFEIIVVADGDTDGSWRVAQENGAKVFRMNTTGGPAKARNRGALSAKGDILFFIDADVVVPSDAIVQISAIFQQEPDLAAVFGSYDDQPFETNFLSQYRNLFHHYIHQSSNEEALTFWGACGAVRREVFLKVGGFDERYCRPAIEDIELGYRLIKTGYRIRLLKELMVTHLKRWDVRTMLKTDFLYRALPWTRLLLREGRFNNDLNLTIASRISVILAYLLCFCIIGGFFAPLLLIASITMAGGLLVFNWKVYRFFQVKRGILFALKTIPWHWLYYLYSGLAFGLGYVEFRLKINRKAFASNIEFKKYQK